MEITLVLTEEELQILDKALTQLPYGEVFNLIDKVNLQIHNQLTEKENEENEEKNSETN